jgi:hypothetical protein
MTEKGSSPPYGESKHFWRGEVLHYKKKEVV